MRINVYGEEITKRLELIEKVADTGSTFVGIRFYLESSDKMYPPKHPDDDSSGVTFWVKSGKHGTKDRGKEEMAQLFDHAAAMLRNT